MSAMNPDRLMRCRTPERDAVLRQMQAGGVERSVICAALKVSSDTLTLWFRQLGLVTRAPTQQTHVAWSDADTTRAIEMGGAGASLGEIGRALGRSPDSVRRRLQGTKPAPKVQMLAGRMPVGSERGTDGALPAGHPVTCALIGIEPFWKGGVNG